MATCWPCPTTCLCTTIPSTGGGPAVWTRQKVRPPLIWTMVGTCCMSFPLHHPMSLCVALLPPGPCPWSHGPEAGWGWGSAPPSWPAQALYPLTCPLTGLFLNLIYLSFTTHASHDLGLFGFLLTRLKFPYRGSLPNTARFRGGWRWFCPDPQPTAGDCPCVGRE